MLGDSGVGKSSLVHRYTSDHFSPNFLPTIGIDYKIKHLRIEDKIGKRNIRLAIWDSAGQERFRNITKQYFRGAHGMVLVYDCSDRASFDNVNNWLWQIDQNEGTEFNGGAGVVITLVANKCDTAVQEVSDEEGQALADERCIRFFKTSAKSNINVSEMFLTLILDIERRLMARQLLDTQKGFGGDGNSKSISLTRMTSSGSTTGYSCCGGMSATTVPLN